MAKIAVIMNLEAARRRDHDRQVMIGAGGGVIGAGGGMIGAGGGMIGAGGGVIGAAWGARTD